MYRRKRLTAALLATAVTMFLAAPAGVYGAENTADLPGEEQALTEDYATENDESLAAEGPADTAEVPQEDAAADFSDEPEDHATPDLPACEKLSGGAEETEEEAAESGGDTSVGKDEEAPSTEEPATEEEVDETPSKEDPADADKTIAALTAAGDKAYIIGETAAAERGVVLI